MAELEFRHRHKTFRIAVTAAGTLQLWLDGVLRKDRVFSGREPQYVWTNVELEWEEHHYLEARYWRSSGRLTIAVNRRQVLDSHLEGPGAG